MNSCKLAALSQDTLSLMVCLLTHSHLCTENLQCLTFTPKQLFHLSVRVILTDGKMHSVDSKDVAFVSAGRLAIKSALSKCGTRLLQPLEHVTFTISEEMQGEINSIVSRNDGYVTGTSGGGPVEIEAYIPSAKIPAVSDSLRAKTGGVGQFVSAFSHYQAVTDDHTIKVVVDESPHRHE